MPELLTETIAAIKESGKCPPHVAIIMDGNGRWARRRNMPRTDGHAAGVKAVRQVVEAATEIGMKYLTLYVFSVDNWNRPKDEVASLMALLSRTTLEELDEMMKNNIRLIATGRINELPLARREVLKSAIRQTANNTGLTLNLALNYGGRTEILDAVRSIAGMVRDGRLDPEDIDERLFSAQLYTAGLPDPDLLIRTSGERRLSNFMMWQTYYTEIYITDTLWPDFGKREFLEAVEDFMRRERRFGRVIES